MSVFSSDLEKKLKDQLTRFETTRSAILPILHLIQDEFGWIKEEHIEALQSEFKLSKVHVYEVLTFYSMYVTKEPKKFRILFCDNVTCTLMGAKESMKEIETYCDNFEKEEKKQSPFSLEGVPCLGVCDQAPAMLINKDRHHLVTASNVREILDQYAKKVVN